MKKRVIALSVLAIIVLLGVISMHAMGLGHSPSPTSRANMAHEGATPDRALSVNGALFDSTADGHASLLPALCVAVLSASFAFAAAAVATRLRALSQREQTRRSPWGRLVVSSDAGVPPPVLMPLRT
jgi:hypothetical protein